MADAPAPVGGAGTGGTSAGGGETAPADAIAGSAKQDPTRVIVYTADISLYVDSFVAVEERLPALVAEHDAYISESDVGKWDNRSRRGKWVLRVPVTKYRALLAAVGGLGRVDSSTSKAEDVTAEYVDLEARQKNKRAVEERLQAILKQQTGKMSDLLEVEREIARVREEIERVEGRMRYIRSLAALSTITLSVYERPGHEPLPEDPSLVERMKWAWQESTYSLVNFVKAMVVLSVRFVVWSPVLALVVGAFLVLGRWRRKRRAAATREITPRAPPP